MVGIILVFFSLGILAIRERTNPYWNMQAYYDCQKNLRNLGRAIDIYREDHDGALPAEPAELEQQYISSPAWLHCPLADRNLTVEDYRYTPAPAKPTDPLITCPNHPQGSVILQHNGLLRLPENTLKRQQEDKARPPADTPIDRGTR
jgi:hypothetical protein